MRTRSSSWESSSIKTTSRFREFVVGFTIGSDEVRIELPVALPIRQDADSDLGRAITLPSPETALQLERISIPNLSITGFPVAAPPEREDPDIRVPPIQGVIIIPGNIAFLDQFFSVIVQTTNLAPAGSGLVVENARATIALPTGDDEIPGSGDDPLGLAETDPPIEPTMPLTDDGGEDRIQPDTSSSSQFLVQGLREGTHRVDFDIEGDLFVPALGDPRSPSWGLPPESSR